MRIRFGKHVHPILEGLTFVEVSTDDERLRNIYRNRLLKEEEKAVIDTHLAAVQAMQAEAGKLLMQLAPELKPLFHIRMNDKMSAMHSFLISVMDFEEYDLSRQLAHIKACIENDADCFLRANASNVDEDRNFAQVSKSELIQVLQETKEEDAYKWKLLLWNETIVTIVERWAVLQEALEAMMKRYQDAIDAAERCYQRAVEHTYAHGNMLDELLAQSSVKITEDTREILLLPTLAGFNSFSYISRDMVEEDMDYILWGIDILALMGNLQPEQTMESLCASLKLLSDPSKFEILRYVSHEKAYGAQIAKELKLTTATISYHVQSLLNTGFLRFEKENNRLYYFLNKDYLEAFLEAVKERLLNNS